MNLTVSQRCDRLIANLKVHSGLAAAKTVDFANWCVVSDYFSRPNHCGGIMVPEGRDPEKRPLSNGRTVAFRDAPLGKVIEQAETSIDKEIDGRMRTDVWNKNSQGLPVCLRRQAGREQPVAGPRGHPVTPCSKSRAVHVFLLHRDSSSFIVRSIERSEHAGLTTRLVTFSRSGICA